MLLIYKCIFIYSFILQTSDPLISSYKYGSLTRIPEFVDFRERLNNSLHFAIVTAEQMLLDLTTEVSSMVVRKMVLEKIRLLCSCENISFLSFIAVILCETKGDCVYLTLKSRKALHNDPI